VASGKGGVGKSTVSVNLALALKKRGFNVGLLDVDVYGPSVPTLLGVQERPNVIDRRISPIEAQGLKLMSLGFLMEDDTPVIWRGPIVTGIIRQFLQDVDWEGVDYLIVDMPPGTGDAQLALAQTVPVDGALVVTTPSDLALIDAARGLRMFQTLNVDVLGIVENMSHYVWPGVEAVESASAMLDGVAGAEKAQAALQAALEAHRKVYIFGKGGGREEAKRLETKFLGEIPLDGDIRLGGDSGKPVMVAAEAGPITDAFLSLADQVVAAKPLEVDGEQAPKKGLFSFIKS
jgi:ATP-binding protein involved in chromosome partitioning